MNKKNNIRKAVPKKIFIRLAVVVLVILAAATVYAVLPSISLNSPTSFPVDI